MATKADLIKDLDYLSTTVGDRSRTIAFAIIAIWWANVVGKEPVSGLSLHALIGPVIFSSAAIFCDFAQYALSYLFAAHQLAALERTSADSFSYDKKALPYKLRQAFFYLKQIFMVIGLALFIGIVWPLIF
jgi:hypothetical protein